MEIVVAVKISVSVIITLSVEITVAVETPVAFGIAVGAMSSFLCRASTASFRTPATRTIVRIEIIIMIILISGPNLLFFAVEIAVGIAVAIVAVEVVSMVYRHVSAGLSSNVAPTAPLSIEGALALFPSVPVTA